MLKVTLPYIVQVLRVIVSKLPREPSVQKVVLEFERTMWSATSGSVQSPDNPVHFPFPPYIGWTNLRSQAQPSGILLNQSDSPASVASESDSLTSPGSAEGSAEKDKNNTTNGRKKSKGL